MQTREHATPPPGWSEWVAHDPGAGPAHRPEVATALAAVLPGHRAVWITVEDSGVTIGGAVGCARSLLGLETLHLMPFLLPGAPLAIAGRHADVDRAIALELARRAAAPGFLGGEWVCYRPDGGVSLDAVELPPGETRELAAANVVIDADPRTLYDRLDRNTRHALRRGWAAGVRFAEEPDALDHVYALHLAQARAWPRYRPLPLALHRRLVLGPGSVPAARVFTARLQRRLVAGIVVLDHPRECLAWWSGAHPQGRAAAVPIGLFWAVIEWAAAAGRRRLNLGGSGGIPGLAAFKRSVGARDTAYPVRWLAPSQPSALARAVRSLQGRARRDRHRGAPA